MTDGPTRPPSLWRHGDFMKLWAGQTISLLGSQVTILALPLTAILLFKATPFQVGVLGALQFAPFLVLGLPIGVWVDRLRRKPILVAADVGRFLVLGSIPLAYELDALRLGHLYVAAFLAGVLTVFFDVAYGSYLPSLIDRERLVEGNSKLEISRSGAQLVGPGLGGILVEALTAPVALLADAVSYLGSVLFLLVIRRREPLIEAPDGVHPRMAGQIREGLRYVLGHPLLRPIVVCNRSAEPGEWAGNGSAASVCGPIAGPPPGRHRCRPHGGLRRLPRRSLRGGPPHPPAGCGTDHHRGRCSDRPRVRHGSARHPLHRRVPAYCLTACSAASAGSSST